MKKICMVAYTNYLSDARPRREAEILVRRGDQVDFLSLAEKDQPAQSVVNGVRILRMRQSRYRGSNSLLYIYSYLRFIFTVSLRLFGLFLRNRYDVIHVHTMPDMVVLTGLLPKLFGARLVLDVHDMMPELYISKFHISERHPLIRLLAFQEQMSIRLASHVICVHEPHLSVLCRRGARPGKISVLPNVPDPSLINFPKIHSPNNGFFRIVYHGTIASRLGLDLVVKAFQQIVDDCPRARLEILGDGDAAAALQAQIAKANLGERIYFSRRLFRVEEAVSLIQGASVGVAPYYIDPATTYMLPVKLLEYVFFGIPTIVSRLLAVQHYFDETQVAYFDSGDVDSLAAVLRRLYNHPEERAALIKNSSVFVEKFRWEGLKTVLYNVEDGLV